MKRSAGILLAVSSLPSEYGIGCFDEAAYRFVDFLAEAGQSWWQILPLGVAGYGDSPYQSFSSYAGNPFYIDLGEFLSEKDCREAGLKDSDRVDYGSLYKKRYPLLKKAFEQYRKVYGSDFKQLTDKKTWLEDYALFMALKEHFGGLPWNEWDDDIRSRKKDVIERYRTELADEAEFHIFTQYIFFKQWKKLKEYANSKGIGIIGDIPIYTAYDSADVWALPELFQLDGNGIPYEAAGCPPDGFSAEGQLWGNPLYNWERHAETGYSWWISRLAHCFELYDVVRIDHFRGFDEYYAIPYGEKNAVRGRWKKGPGMDFFKAADKKLGRKAFIAEDLGFMTESVKKLLADSGFPGMKILEFAFDSRDKGMGKDHLPHNYNEKCVAYTGTHDNQTLRSWFESITDEERKKAREYLCDFFTPDEKLNIPFIGAIMRSKAELCIVPVQDWLGLDDSSRMNTPSTVGGNWQWRLKKDALTDELAGQIYSITENTGRI